MIALGVKAYAAFGHTWTAPDWSLVWTEIPLRTAEGVSTWRGRQSYLERFQPGEISCSLNNTDRKYDKRNAAGPYAGMLLPGVPIKLVLTVGAGDSGYTEEYEEEYSGSVERIIARGYIAAWPQVSNEVNTFGTVALQAFGVLSRGSRASFPYTSVLEMETLVDEPVAYWRLDDTSEAAMLDSSGFHHDGVYDNPELGKDPLVKDGGHAAQFRHTADSRGRYTGGFVTEYPFSMRVTFQIERHLDQSRTVVAALRDAAETQLIRMRVPDNGGGFNPDGGVRFGIRTDDQRTLQGSVRVDDELIHQVFARAHSPTNFDLWVDGVKDAGATYIGTVGAPSDSSFDRLRFWSVGNNIDQSSGDFGLGGILDDVAVFPDALSQARVEAHYQASTAPWDGDKTGARIERIALALGLPADRLVLDEGQTRLGPAEDLNAHIIDLWQDVEAAEDGRLFETADGRLRFLNRTWGYTEDQALNVQVAFSDNPADVAAGTHYPYVATEIPDSDELMCNVAVGRRRGGTEIVVRDEASVALHGEFDDDFVDLIVTDDTQVRSLLEYKVATRAQPRDVMPGIRIPLHKLTPTQVLAVLDLEIGHRCSQTRTPQGIGDPWTIEGIIERIAFQINGTDDAWMILDLSPAPGEDESFWRWGESTWGETTRWGW